jgi:hypothetical protein
VTPSQEDSIVPAQDTSRFRARVVLVVAAVVLVVTAALAIVGLQRHSDTSSLNRQRATVSAVAGQLAVDFTSIDYRHLQQEFTATAAHATPAFAKKYLATVKAFAPLYRKGKVVQTTSVDVAGIESMTADSAVVLVALKGIAKNTAAPTGTQQLFRMQIDLAKQGKVWLASNVQPI